MATNYFLNQYFSTFLNVGGGIDASQTTGIIVQAVSGLDITKPGIACFSYSDPIDTSLAEWITYTSIDGSNELQGVTRGAEGFAAKSHSNQAVVVFPLSESHINTLATALSIGGVATTGVTTTLDEDDMATNSATALATQQSIKAYVDTNKGLISATQYAPSGFLINGKIVPSVASNDLTVAIKGIDGNDPSASNPVYIRIGDTVRSITSALSVTKNDGTNWFNAGSTELATKEIDYFVYLGYNATDGVVIGFARIPYATKYDDFSTTSTNEKYCAISTITNAAATDYYEVIGRFAATLSAGAGYTWTVPTFTAKNLIQRPIYETRKLTFNFTVASWVGGAAPSGAVSHYTENYQIRGAVCRIEVMLSYATAGTTVTSAVTNPLPMSVGSTYNNMTFGKIFVDGGGGYIAGADNTTIPQFRSANAITLFCSSHAAKVIALIGEYDLI